MSNIYTSDINLNSSIDKICSLAIQSTCNILLEKLQSLIMSEYYDLYSPRQYERTYQFYDSAMTQMLSSRMGEIFMDENRMDYGDDWNGKLQLQFANRGFHGSSDIYTEGYYWDSFIEYCNKNALNILKRELIKYGLNIS